MVVVVVLVLVFVAVVVVCCADVLICCDADAVRCRVVCLCASLRTEITIWWRSAEASDFFATIENAYKCLLNLPKM